MDKREAIGGIFRGLLTGGSWMRLAMWARKSSDREINVTLRYVDSQATWALILKDGTEEAFNAEGPSLEQVTVLAVAALGKAL